MIVYRSDTSALEKGRNEGGDARWGQWLQRCTIPEPQLTINAIRNVKIEPRVGRRDIPRSRSIFHGGKTPEGDSVFLWNAHETRGVSPF